LPRAALAQPAPDLLRGVVAHRPHQVVVGIGEGRGQRLAFRGIGVAAQRAVTAAAAAADAQAEVGLGGVTLGHADLHAGAVVDHGQHGLGLLELQAAGQRADRAELATERAQHAADAAGVALREVDARVHGVVGGDHLALAEASALAQFAADHLSALLHTVPT